jgi:hypothetical protein
MYFESIFFEHVFKLEVMNIISFEINLKTRKKIFSKSKMKHGDQSLIGTSQCMCALILFENLKCSFYTMVILHRDCQVHSP